MYQKSVFLAVCLMLFTVTQTIATTYDIEHGSDVIGNVQYTFATWGESLAEVGRRYDIGAYEMIEANPKLDPWTPFPGARIVIPSEFVLPSGNRRGIVINLAEMRMYYYHRNQAKVTTHPIGIGKKGWNTPLGRGVITAKVKDPAWRPPKSIREAHRKQGEILPRIVPPGPDNPLGKYAMRLSIPGYLIHGTNQKGGIGLRSSRGCIRMFPEDIKTFFRKVAIGTPVRIIHAPYKVGKQRENVVIEAHQPLSDPYYRTEPDHVVLAQALEEALMDLHWLERIASAKVLEKALGYPIRLN